MVDLNDMVIFAKVAEHQGISPAARALSMPKSKVSRRMAVLEEVLGTRLLERSTRSVRVTAAGQLYLQHCQRVVEEVESAEESVQSLVETPKGHLRIGTSVAIGQYLIAPYLAEFMRAYPDIEVSLDLNNRRLDLIAEGYDLVVRVGELADSSLISKRFGMARASLYASPEYLARYGSPELPEQFSDHRVVIMSGASRNYQWRLEDPEGQLKVVNVKPALNVNDFSSLRTVVAAGAGIGHFPYYVVQDLVAAGQLQAVLPDWCSPAITYYVLYPSTRGLTRKAKVWIEFFASRLEDVVPLEL